MGSWCFLITNAQENTTVTVLITHKFLSYLRQTILAILYLFHKFVGNSVVIHNHTESITVMFFLSWFPCNCGGVTLLYIMVIEIIMIGGIFLAGKIKIIYPSIFTIVTENNVHISEWTYCSAWMSLSCLRMWTNWEVLFISWDPCRYGYIRSYILHQVVFLLRGKVWVNTIGIP